jgi:hypothetical protein
MPVNSIRAPLKFKFSLLLACILLSFGECVCAQQLISLCKSSEAIEKAREQLDRSLFARYRPNLAVKVLITNATLDRTTVHSKEGVVRRGVICRADIELTVNERSEILTRALTYEVDSESGQVGIPPSSMSSIERQFAVRMNVSSDKAKQDFARKLCSEDSVFRKAQKQLTEHLIGATQSSEVRFSASNPIYEGRGGPRSGKGGPSFAICRSDIALTLNGRSALLPRRLMYYVSMDEAQQVTVERSTASALIAAFDREIERKEREALNKTDKPNSGRTIFLK